MENDGIFRVGSQLYGSRMKNTVVALSSIHPFVEMSFVEGWNAQVEYAFTYLNSRQDTPLWYWRQ